MFLLPDTWEETRGLLEAIQQFFDRSPMIYVLQDDNTVAVFDFDHLCANMGPSLESFLRTGLCSAWPVPVEIYGRQADWIMLTCGLVPDRPRDFVIRWNVRCITRPPSWAVNKPGISAFFPHLAFVKNNCGQLDTFVWQQIWQQATTAFFNTNVLQQLFELKRFCDHDMANTTWRFREDVLVALLAPKQRQEWLQTDIGDESTVEPVESRQVDGFLVLPLMVCCKGDGHNATFFCTVCSQLYCDSCSLLPDHNGHIFKFLKQ